MSLNFWITLSSALTLFILSLAAIQIYKSGLIRNFLARLLRKKLCPLLNAIVVELQGMQVVEFSDSNSDYVLRMLRAELEILYAKSKPLFDQERLAIEKVLINLSQLSAQFNHSVIDKATLESTILLAQRASADLSEIRV